MRIAILLVIFASIGPSSFSQKNKLKKNPPGTVRVNDTLFVDITEVANVHWREYCFYLLEFDSLHYDQALPDTTVWESYTIDSITRYYFRHPGFNDYPVVGISYAQATQFCKWRTFAVNFKIYTEENNLTDWQLHMNDSFPIRYYYRLPTKAEWEMIAAGKHDTANYSYGYDSIY